MTGKNTRPTATKTTLGLELQGIDLELKNLYLEHRIILIRIERLQAERRKVCSRIDTTEEE